MSEERSCLIDAEAIVSGQRQEDYGRPKQNHEATAAFWEIYMRRKYGIEIVFSARDVCMMNILQKISRDCCKSIHDNLVDICGYVRNIELCEE